MIFDKVKDSDKVWVFASEVPITTTLQQELSKPIIHFLSNWKAHNHQLRAEMFFEDNHFLIIVLDESFEKASGCSIDSMIHFIKSIETTFSLTLTNRALIFYQNDREIGTFPFNQMKEMINKSVINGDSIIFDNSITNGKELKAKWKVRASDAWISRFFNKQHV